MAEFNANIETVLVLGGIERAGGFMMGVQCALAHPEWAQAYARSFKSGAPHVWEGDDADGAVEEIVSALAISVYDGEEPWTTSA